MKEFFKNIRKVVTVAVVTVLTGLAVGLVVEQTTQAQPQPNSQYYNPNLVINSAGAPGTNMIFGPTTNGYFPQGILGGFAVTNFLAKFDVSGYKEISIQLSGSASASVGTVPNQSVILTVYRSISGGSSTNAIGTGLLFDTLGTITLPAAISTSGPWTVISNYCNAVSPIAGVTTIYLAKLDAGALTNNVFFTNYTARVSGK